MLKTLSLISAIVLFITQAKSAIAVSTPSFPACANPQGSLKVSYSEGTHGIVGSSATYTGKDTVYTLSDITLTQCFCSTDGNGIQTNWWKASSLTESEVNILKSEGWHYVPNGSLWGLAVDPYVAKNISYSCLSTNTTTSTNNSSTASHSDNGVGGGDVLGVSSGEVLGLAATGDSILVYVSFVLGFILTKIGIKRFKQAK